jgi:uncharacterized protein YxeA
MKRIFFIVLIVAVLGVVGFYAFNEFSVPEILYVSDKTTSTARGTQTVIHRLYNSGVDSDTFYETVTAHAVKAEFTDEEIEAAALKSGTPEFYPAFYFNLNYSDSKTKTYVFHGSVVQEIAPKQTAANFKLTNVHVEISAPDFEISDVKYETDNKNVKSVNSPVISDDKHNMTMGLDNLKFYEFNLSGKENGRISFIFTYDIASNSLFSSTVMTEQLLMVYADVTYSEENGENVTFITEPYSKLEDMDS